MLVWVKEVKEEQIHNKKNTNTNELRNVKRKQYKINKKLEKEPDEQTKTELLLLKMHNTTLFS